MHALPIDSVLPNLREALTRKLRVVLSADPGAGKTTRVPLALLQEPWLGRKKIVVLEPRRLAAQRAATHMAQLLGEHPGETVGYRIRGESKVSDRTRIEVVTEGILTRMLQADAALSDVAGVLFDEYHERSIHADLGLALTLDVQEHLRNDLRILVMSATLNGLEVATLLRDPEMIKSEGRTFPVITHYARHARSGAVEPLVVLTIVRALAEEPGDLLVFLPGQREIRRVESRLLEAELPSGVVVHTLFGDAPPEKQQAALAPAPPGKRKVILSTSVAETSLTIDGVRVVIDSGLARSAQFDPSRGMSGLTTTPVSRASADQRRGRAGRQEAGTCYRLWTEKEHAQLPLFAQPEILTADLAPLALELARWGDPEGYKLRFLDAPPAAHLSRARDLLKRLGALGDQAGLTDHGRAMSEIPVHPRLAHMLIRGKTLGLGSLACDVAALLEERDLLRSESDADIDLFSRWHALRTGNTRDRFARQRALAEANRLRALLHVADRKTPEEKLGVLLALAYPERVAKQRNAGGKRYLLAGGIGAALPRESLLAREQYLAVGDVDSTGSDVRVFLAAPLSLKDIHEVFVGSITTTEEVRWDAQREEVVARSVTRYGELELAERPLNPPAETVQPSVLEGIRLLGLDALPWNKESLSLRVRSQWLRERQLVDKDWPDLSTQHLLASLQTWLGPYLGGMTRRAHFQKLDLGKIIRAIFSSQQLRELDRLAPTHFTLPTGSRVPLDYSADGQPLRYGFKKCLGKRRLRRSQAAKSRWYSISSHPRTGHLR
jgi:ATP-dependent helicase HrpB